jgi:hypothetical protein
LSDRDGAIAAVPFAAIEVQPAAEAVAVNVHRPVVDADLLPLLDPRVLTRSTSLFHRKPPRRSPAHHDFMKALPTLAMVAFASAAPPSAAVRAWARHPRR